MGEPMNTEIETEPDEKLGMEHSASLPKLSHIPATASIIQGGNEVEEQEIAPDHPILATSEKRDTKTLTPISEEIFAFLNCNGNYRASTPLSLPPMTPTRSGPPASKIKRMETTLTFIPSSETQNMEIELVKETSSSQGWTPDLSMLSPLVQREAISPDHAAPMQRQATSVAPVLDEMSIETQANSPFMPAAFTAVASSGPISVQTSVRCDKNLSNELLSICRENAERMWQCIDSYMSQSQVHKEVTRLKEELQNAMSEKNAAFERARVLENILKEQNERLQIESERSQAIEAACLEMLQEYRELARLKEFAMSEKDVELTSLKYSSSMIEERNVELEQRNTVLEDQIDHVNRLLQAEKLNSKNLSEQLGKTVNEKDKLMEDLTAYNDVLARIKGITHAELTATPSQLNEKCEEQAERLYSESNWSQATEATLRELLREYRAQKSEASDKVEELTSLKHNNTMLRERSIEAKQRNDELKTYNGGLDMIQGCIRRSLTARISRLRQASTTVKVGHYEDLLARIDALGQVNEHLPKISETIEIAASLSAYSAAASIFVSLRAYHGDNFDLQRLLLPLHLNRQEYARIRNAVDPLAAQVAQKYEVCKR
ncbi:hypothetical protein EJB05_15465 [Eragrostis curvula]|uniref:Uncharacterized protein n=1 Tax=Eragrostis curvula TaxID=38414 RepID=A0A5J9W211_9POAL|nr:hypothetical protein EJB05_15465 [Eragrostis curvula]